MNDLIERLETDKQRLFGLGLKRIADDIAEAQKEIERLKTENHIFADNINELIKQRDAFAMTIDELRRENKQLKGR